MGMISHRVVLRIKETMWNPGCMITWQESYLVQPDSDLIFVSRSSESFFWMPSSPSPSPRRVDEHLGRATLLVASLSPQLPSALLFLYEHLCGWPHTGRASSDMSVHLSCMFWFPIEVRTEYCSLESYNVVGAHVFLSLIFYIYWAFIPYLMFFGEHFLGGGNCVHMEAPAQAGGTALWSEGTGYSYPGLAWSLEGDRKENQLLIRNSST